MAFDDVPAGEDGLIVGRLTDLSGPLAMRGTIDLRPPSNYELRALLKAGPGAPNEIVQSMQLLGPPDPDGFREFVISGSL